MKHNKKAEKIHLAKIAKIAKELGLKGSAGIYTSGNGFIVDLTACNPERKDVLATIGYQAIN